MRPQDSAVVQTQLQPRAASDRDDSVQRKSVTDVGLDSANSPMTLQGGTANVVHTKSPGRPYNTALVDLGPSRISMLSPALRV